MFDLPANAGTQADPICLSQPLIDQNMPDYIGRMALKPHLLGQLCNSIAIGSEVKALNVVAGDNMKKYEITWTAIDWCATSAARQLSFTQEVIAITDPGCAGEMDSDTSTTNFVTGVMDYDPGEVIWKKQLSSRELPHFLVPGQDGLSSRDLQLTDGVQPNVSLDQNRPNPFNGETIIGFRLSKATTAVLSIYDITGRLIKTVEGDFQAGYNEVRLTVQDLGVTGVLYYQLDAGEFVATKRMVIVN